MNGHVARELRRFRRVLGKEAPSMRVLKRAWNRAPRPESAAQMDLMQVTMQRIVREAARG